MAVGATADSGAGVGVGVGKGAGEESPQATMAATANAKTPTKKYLSIPSLGYGFICLEGEGHRVGSF